MEMATFSFDLRSEDLEINKSGSKKAREFRRDSGSKCEVQGCGRVIYWDSMAQAPVPEEFNQKSTVRYSDCQL